MWVVIFLFFSCLFSSCEKQNHVSQNTLRLNIVDEPQSLDPRKARDLSGITVMKMLFEGLTHLNKEEKPELALAERYVLSEDLKTYTFFLKETFWSNGDPLTAHDFVYAFKKMLSPDFPTDTAFQLYVIKNAKAAKEKKEDLDAIGVRAIDERILEITLEHPTPYFLSLLSYPAFFPVHAAQDQNHPEWISAPEHYISNGPFQLKEWKHQSKIVVEKNPRYWDAKNVKMQALELVMLPAATELKMFEKKELDWAGSPLSTLPTDALKFLKQNYSVKTKGLLGTSFIRVQTRVAPLHQPLLRKALAMAINRQAIVDHVTQGGQTPATGLVPLSLGTQEAPYFEDAHVKEAARLFEEGLKVLAIERSSFPEISLLYRSEERNHVMAQALQQQWLEALGIHVRLEAVERKVYFDRVSKQEYQLALGSWIADFEDPINFLEVFKSPSNGSNNTGWENREYTEKLEASYLVADPDKRLELLRASEKILIDEMPIIPIFYSNMLYLSQPQVQDVVLSSMGIVDFKWASCEER